MYQTPFHLAHPVTKGRRAGLNADLDLVGEEYVVPQLKVVERGRQALEGQVPTEPGVEPRMYGMHVAKLRLRLAGLCKVARWAAN